MENTTEPDPNTVERSRNEFNIYCLCTSLATAPLAIAIMCPVVWKTYHDKNLELFVRFHIIVDNLARITQTSIFLLRVCPQMVWIILEDSLYSQLLAGAISQATGMTSFLAPCVVSIYRFYILLSSLRTIKMRGEQSRWMLVFPVCYLILMPLGLVVPMLDSSEDFNFVYIRPELNAFHSAYGPYMVIYAIINNRGMQVFVSIALICDVVAILIFRYRRKPVSNSKTQKRRDVILFIKLLLSQLLLIFPIVTLWFYDLGVGKLRFTLEVVGVFVGDIIVGSFTCFVFYGKPAQLPSSKAANGKVHPKTPIARSGQKSVSTKPVSHHRKAQHRRDQVLFIKLFLSQVPLVLPIFANYFLWFDDGILRFSCEELRVLVVDLGVGLFTCLVFYGKPAKLQSSTTATGKLNHGNLQKSVSTVCN